jgi:hypothetical protein
MADAKDGLLEAILDPDEGKRVLAVSELVYGIEDCTRSIALLLGGLAQVSAAKNDSEITRELWAAKNLIDGINTELGSHWFALRLHHAKKEEAPTADRTVH